MEWGILMAITEDMTSNTLQQRMIPKKTQTKTLVEILYNWKSSGAVLFLTLLSAAKSEEKRMFSQTNKSLARYKYKQKQTPWNLDVGYTCMLYSVTKPCQ